MAETAKELSKKREVREALEQTASRKKRTPEKTDQLWFVTHLLLLAACAVLYFLVGSSFIPLPQAQLNLARRLLLGAGTIIIILAISDAISLYSISRVSDRSTRFTLKRIKRLIVFSPRSSRRDLGGFC